MPNQQAIQRYLDQIMQAKQIYDSGDQKRGSAMSNEARTALQGLGYDDNQGAYARSTSYNEAQNMLNQERMQNAYQQQQTGFQNALGNFANQFSQQFGQYQQANQQYMNMFMDRFGEYQNQSQQMLGQLNQGNQSLLQSLEKQRMFQQNQNASRSGLGLSDTNNSQRQGLQMGLQNAQRNQTQQQRGQQQGMGQYINSRLQNFGRSY